MSDREKRKEKKIKKHQMSAREFESRVDMVLELLLNGLREPRIVELASQKFNVTSRSVQRYIKAAKKRIKPNVPIDDETRALYLAMRMQLYSKAIAQNDLSTALRVLVDIGKFKNAYSSLEVNIKVELTPNERVQQMYERGEVTQAEVFAVMGPDRATALFLEAGIEVTESASQQVLVMGEGSGE